MRLRTYVILPLVLLLISGCAIHSRYIEKRDVLDKSLYYYEQDAGGKEIGISDDAVDKVRRMPTRVPQPQLVDINSLINILVAKDRLSSGDDKGLLSVRHEKLLNRKEAI